MDKIYKARSEGFVDGYIQVFIDGHIDGWQLIEGLELWDIDIDQEVLNNPDYSWMDEDQKQEIIEALKIND